jgi:hypothetical protein
MMRLGEVIVFMTMAVLIGIIGYKVCGAWVPWTIFGSFAVGTYANYKTRL